jgi:hypothetical protein
MQDVAQGLAIAEQITAANEDFIAPANGVVPVSAPLGWDPYEVWRTRVKVPAAASPEAEREPLG